MWKDFLLFRAPACGLRCCPQSPCTFRQPGSIGSRAPVAALQFAVGRPDPSNEFFIPACVAESAVCSRLLAPPIGLHEFSWWVPLVSPAHSRLTPPPSPSARARRSQTRDHLLLFVTEASARLVALPCGSVSQTWLRLRSLRFACSRATGCLTAVMRNSMKALSFFTSPHSPRCSAYLEMRIVLNI